MPKNLVLCTAVTLAAVSWSLATITTEALSSSRSGQVQTLQVPDAATMSRYSYATWTKHKSASGSLTTGAVAQDCPPKPVSYCRATWKKYLIIDPFE